MALAWAGPSSPTAPARRERVDLDYPTPELEPRTGFTVDKALVYAIVRQESRFNPQAVSPVGADGPDAADARRRRPRRRRRQAARPTRSPLFDPAFNLRVGQDYFTWLMERGVGYDLSAPWRPTTAGPAPLLKTAQMLGDDADSLLLIECLPARRPATTSRR